MFTQEEKQIETYNDFVHTLHWRPVTLPDGTFVDEYKIKALDHLRLNFYLT
jgi:hypothetical protein